ncbi:UNVERIFIED_CONTAM: hypothetical protein HDU68_001814, partial [Siphonaria sp. JEL0065]
MVDKVDMFERIKEAALTEMPVDLTFGETRGGAISVVHNGLKALESLGVKDEVLAQPHHQTAKPMAFVKMDGSDPILVSVLLTSQNSNRSLCWRHQFSILASPSYNADRCRLA